MTEVVPLNNRFEVLTTHTHTSNEVLDTTFANTLLHSANRVCKQHIVDTKTLDTDINKLDPVVMLTQHVYKEVTLVLHSLPSVIIDLY